MKEFYERWCAITSDQEILQTVKGLRIIVNDDLPESRNFQYPLGKEEELFVDKEINRLLKKGIIRESCHEPGEWISPIFTRPKSDGDGYRLILNLKKLNEVSDYQHFKMDTMVSVLAMIYPGVYMAKLDIKDAYYTVPIDSDDQNFLKFSFKDMLYQFLALPNGYTKGPRKFTKLLKPLLSQLRQEGISLLAYLDDIIVIDWSLEGCRRSIFRVMEVLQYYGFTIHPDKCVLEPSTSMEFLGFLVNSISMSVELPHAKKLVMIELCNEILIANESRKGISIRTIARLLGKIASSFLAIYDGRMHYRKLERFKMISLARNRGNYDKFVHFSTSVAEEICWWRDNILDSYAPIIRNNPDLVINTDACNYGWGASMGGISTGGLFEAEESEVHINILESKAVYFGLKSLCDFPGSHILVRSDNTATVGAISKMGSSKSIRLDNIITSIWEWALARNIWLSSTHIPGKFNEEADKESRKFEIRTEWKLDPSIFHAIEKGLQFWPDIDLFASRINNQLPKFAAFRPDPEAYIIDAFTVSWGELAFYAFPPFICVAKVIQKIITERATGILIVPNWLNQPWFNLFQKIIIHEIFLPPRDDLLHLPSNPEISHPMSKSLALRAALVSGTALSPN